MGITTKTVPALADKGALRGLVEYPPDFQEAVEERMDRILPIQRRFFGIEIERPAVYYSPYTPGTAAALYISEKNAVMITPHVLRYWRSGAKRELNDTIAHELVHASVKAVSGVETTGIKFRIGDVLRILAMKDGGTAKLTQIFEESKDWEKVYRLTNEAVAVFVAAYTTRVLANKSQDLHEVLSDVLRAINDYAYTTLFKIRPDMLRIPRDPADQLRNADEVKPKDSPGILSGRYTYNLYVHPQVEMVSDCIKAVDASPGKKIQQFVIETILKSVPLEMTQTSPLWDSVKSEITPQSAEKWVRALLDGLVTKDMGHKELLTKIEGTIMRASKMANTLWDKASRGETVRIERPSISNYTPIPLSPILNITEPYKLQLVDPMHVYVSQKHHGSHQGYYSSRHRHRNTASDKE